jgi:hypothetical protein
LNNAFAALAGPNIPSAAGGGTVVQALASSPLWAVGRSTRSFVNATLKYGNATAKVNKVPGSTSDGTFTALSTIGFLATLENTIAKGGFSAGPQLFSSTSNALGFLKYGGEIVAGLAKDPAIAKALAGHFGFALQDVKGKPTLFYKGFNLTTLTKTPFFKALGSSYYGAGALASLLSLQDDLNNHDGVGAGLDSLELVGNLLNAAKPLVENIAEDFIEGAAKREALGEAFGAVGSALALLSAVGSAIKQGIQNGEAQSAFQADSNRFLEVGGNINPDVAWALSHPQIISSSSTIAGLIPTETKDLLAYANANHLSPGELLARLNQQDPSKVAFFANVAAEGSVERLNAADREYTVSNLTLLTELGTSLFGPNWLNGAGTNGP